MNCRIHTCCERKLLVCCHQCNVKNCKSRCLNTPGIKKHQCKLSYEPKAIAEKYFVTKWNQYLRFSARTVSLLGDCVEIEELQDGFILRPSDTGVKIKAIAPSVNGFLLTKFKNKYDLQVKHRYIAENLGSGLKIKVGLK